MTAAPERGRRTVVVLTLLTTIVAAIVAGLSVDAGSHADLANRESERLVLVEASRSVSDGADQDYQSRLVAEVLAGQQESLVHSYASIERQTAGDAAGAKSLDALAKAAQASADQGMKLSDVYADPQYAPASADTLPDLQGYLKARTDVEQDLVAQQNAASDEYGLWNSRSDTYTAILSVLAITLFLLGLAQVSKRMRLFLGWCGGALLVLAVAWTGITALT